MVLDQLRLAVDYADWRPRLLGAEYHLRWPPYWLLSSWDLELGEELKLHAVHAARQYLDVLPSNHAVLKLDFRNAFNSVYRDKMLEAVSELPLISTPLYIPSTPHHPSCHGKTGYYSLQKVSSKVTLLGHFSSASLYTTIVIV